MVCVFAPLTFGLFWSRTSLAGAWAGIFCGGLSWFVCYLLDTSIYPTLIGTPVSCVALVVVSLIKPDSKE